MLYTLSAVTKLSTHWMCDPISSSARQDLSEMAASSSRDKAPAPGILRSITYLGMASPFLEAVYNRRFGGWNGASVPKVSSTRGKPPERFLKSLRHSRKC